MIHHWLTAVCKCTQIRAKFQCFKVETSLGRSHEFNLKSGIVRADCERIRTISFDDKSKTITIVGPFDPHRLACKLRCKGGKVIRDIHIVDNGAAAEDGRAATVAGSEPAKNGRPKHDDEPLRSPNKLPKQPRPPCRPCEQAPVEYVIPTVEIPSLPAPPVGPCGCPCCAPCHLGYYEGCRCCCCGRLYAQPLRAPAGCGYRSCRTFSDEDPTAACSIM